MDYETIMLKKDKGVATITLNRPDRLNAVNRQMLRELLEATKELSQDNSVKVVVLTGASQAFCAGADVFDHPAFKVESREEIRQMVLEFGAVSLALRSLPQPVIASVSGVAVGAGCNFALACDIIIASENARFGQVFVNLGLVPDSGGIYFVPRLVGTAKACELMFTGDIIDAKEAERIGLVNKVVPTELLDTATKELASRLAKGPSLAINIIKTSIYKGLSMDLASVLEREADTQAVCLLSDDGKEGLRAFREKRKPKFKGR